MKIDKTDLLKLTEILQKEISVYTKLLSIEEEKSKAIKKADGKILENLTKKTDSETQGLNLLESERNSLLSKMVLIKDQNFSINDFLNALNPEDGKTLIKIVESLRTVIFTLKKTLKLNEKMIHMKQNLLAEILENCKKQIKVQVYSGKDSKENQNSNPLIFNLTA